MFIRWDWRSNRFKGTLWSFHCKQRCFCLYSVLGKNMLCISGRPNNRIQCHFRPHKIFVKAFFDNISIVYTLCGVTILSCWCSGSVSQPAPPTDSTVQTFSPFGILLVKNCFTAPQVGVNVCKAPTSQNHILKSFHISQQCGSPSVFQGQTQRAVGSLTLQMTTRSNCLARGHKGGPEGSRLTLCRRPICPKTLPLTRRWIITI